MITLGLSLLLNHGYARAHADDARAANAAAAGSACERSILSVDVKAPLREAHAAARAKLDAVRAAANAVDKVERKYFGEVARGAEAALGKHHAQFEAAKNLRLMDIPHHMEILRAIAAFDDATPRASMVRIAEAIKLRHALPDYLECAE